VQYKLVGVLLLVPDNDESFNASLATCKEASPNTILYYDARVGSGNLTKEEAERQWKSITNQPVTIQEPPCSPPEPSNT
jgi:hypothetical protein